MIVDLKALKRKAHALKPVIWLGQHGLTDAVLAELEIALHAHELIKAKIVAETRAARLEIAEKMATTSGATLVQLIGQIAILYRKNNELPKNKVKKTAPKR